MIILLTNDDGITAPGLLALEACFRDRPHALPAGEGRVRPSRVVTVAPAFPSSGQSRAITLYRPVRSEEVAVDRFQLDGTPADCVLWGIKHLANLMTEQVGLVVSGINHGPNLGDDIAFSGTVSAALEAARFGVPALAISLAADNVEKGYDFTHAVEYAHGAAEKLLRTPLPAGVAVSMNVPKGRPLGIIVTRPGNRHYADIVSERIDPFGRPYYWLADGGQLACEAEKGTDIEAVSRGYVSVTPLDSDFHAGYTDLSSWQT